MHPTANVCQTKESLFAVRIRLLGSVNEEVSIQVGTQPYTQANGVAVHHSYNVILRFIQFAT